jgi:aerobic-type carbon monoxide dehydrogenase small subunit (CoxS/CutS family)
MTVSVSVTVNGVEHRRDLEPRLLLSDFLRHELRLSGTRVGCEHGVCGACTIRFDGAPVRSCLMFAAQADGHAIATVEGLAPAGGGLSPLQQAFQDAHGLQCGYCGGRRAAAAPHHHAAGYYDERGRPAMVPPPAPPAWVKDDADLDRGPPPPR